MADVTIVARNDADIFDDVQRLARTAFSTRLSRGNFQYAVRNGVVTVKGHLSSRIGYDLFIDNLMTIDGVVAVDDRELFDDETLRLQIGEILPRGMRMRIQHGVVALLGRLDPNSEEVLEALAAIGEMPGIVGINIDSLRS